MLVTPKLKSFRNVLMDIAQADGSAYEYEDDIKLYDRALKVVADLQSAKAENEIALRDALQKLWAVNEILFEVVAEASEWQHQIHSHSGQLAAYLEKVSKAVLAAQEITNPDIG